LNRKVYGDLGFIEQGVEYRRLGVAGSNRLPVSLLWSLQPLPSRRKINFLDQVVFGQRLRYVLEVLEAGNGVALFLPRLAFYGAVVLFVSLVGHILIDHAAVLHCRAAFLVLLLAVTVLIALLRRPSASAREGRSAPRRKTGAFCLRLG
jgi:hypothetical protein